MEKRHQEAYYTIPKLAEILIVRKKIYEKVYERDWELRHSCRVMDPAFTAGPQTPNLEASTYYSVNIFPKTSWK